LPDVDLFSRLDLASVAKQARENSARHENAETIFSFKRKVNEFSGLLNRMTFSLDTKDASERVSTDVYSSSFSGGGGPSSQWTPSLL
jgi:hypothetical protein